MIGTARTSSGSNEDDGRRGLQQALDRDRREDEAEAQRAGVAHEDPRREEVVAEEAEARAGDDRREDRGIGLAEREREDRVRRPGDPAHAGREPVHPVEEVDHVHHGDDEEHRDRDPDPRRDVEHADEGEREVVDPDAELGGIDAATNCPTSFTDGESPRKSSTAPTTVATAAPSSTPRLSPERSRNASAGTRIPRKIASPPSRGIGRRLILRASGRSTAPSIRAIPPTAGREEDDDDERDDRPVEDLRRRPQLVEHAAPLLRPVEAVACVAEAREDVALLVQPAIDGRDDDVDVGVLAVNALRCPRARR